MRPELLTQCALFVLESMQKGHAESAFRDACRTSSNSLNSHVTVQLDVRWNVGNAIAQSHYS